MIRFLSAAIILCAVVSSFAFAQEPDFSRCRCSADIPWST